MKPMLISQDVFPLGAFKTQASQVIRQVRETHRPAVITQHGRPTVVLISVEDFDDLTTRSQFMDSVSRGLGDMEAGRMIDDEQLGRELDAEFGPLEEP